MTTDFRELEAAALDAMTAEERARFDAAAAEEEARLRVAELVYAARKRAKLTQGALAARMGTTQSVVSAVENGAQLPSFVTLDKFARALGMSLRVEFQDVA